MALLQVSVGIISWKLHPCSQMLSWHGGCKSQSMQTIKTAVNSLSGLLMKIPWEKKHNLFYNSFELIQVTNTK